MGKTIRSGDWILAGRVWYNTKTGESMRAIQGGALPATDAFDSSGDYSLSTYSANWTIALGAVYTYSADDSVQGKSSGENAAYWDADAFNANQYSQVSLKVATGAGGWIGPACRVRQEGASTADYYGWYVSPAQPSGTRQDSFVVIDGSWTSKSTSTVALSAGDILKITANGTTVTMYRNGSTTDCPTAWTDSGIDSGYAGLSTYWDIFEPRIDDFEGGNLDTTPTINKSDTVTVTESKTVATLLSAGISKSETVNTTDTPTARLISYVSKSETVGTSDTPTVNLLLSAGISKSETVGTSETTAAEVGAPQVSKSEAVGVTDTPTVSMETPPETLGIAITPDSVFAVGVRIH